MDFSSINFSSIDFSTLDLSSVSTSGMNVTNWITLIGIIVAVLSALIAAGASIYQSISAKRNNEKTLELQKKLAQDNIEANIVSKARLEWIQEARQATSNFITECSNLIFIIQSVKSDGIYKNIKIEKVTEFLSSIIKTSNLLILYFGTDYGENDEIVTKIVDIKKSFNDEKSLNKINLMQIEQKIEDLRDMLRVYFKKEWLRVSNFSNIDGENEKKKKRIKDSYIQKNYSLEELRHKKEYLQIERTNVKNSTDYKSAEINQILNKMEDTSNQTPSKSKLESERNMLVFELESTRNKLKSKQNVSDSDLEACELNFKMLEIEIKLTELDQKDYESKENTITIINIFSMVLALTAFLLSLSNLKLSFLSIFFIILLIPFILLVRYLSVIYLNKKIREERIKMEKINNDLIGRLEEIDLEIEIVGKAIEYLEKQDKNK